MIILTESQKLSEMAIRVISDDANNLPFKVTVQVPEPSNIPHAHLRGLRNPKQKIGAFIVPSRPPTKPEDLKDYEEGLSEENRSIVFSWINRPSKVAREAGLQGTNWQTLWYECTVNKNSKLR
jgi:hypothetical protein